MAPGSDEILASSPGATVRRTVLPSGVRVLTEQVAGMRSVSFGAWISMGSRDESDGHYGSTHFLEHLLFKGTPTRNALEIASAFDSVGGDANAATAKEYTCYYARVLDHDSPMAVDVIMDMLTSSLLDSGEFESEREVILEELAMAQDDPTEVAADAFAYSLFGSHPLGRPIGGTPETILAVPRSAVWEHYQENYSPSTLVITAAGGVDHDALVAKVDSALHRGGWYARFSALSMPAARPQELATYSSQPLVIGTPGQKIDSIIATSQFVPRPIEQAHVLLGGVGIANNDERRFAMSVLNAVLGGSMSSRLFQEVREKRGLAYSVYSFGSSYLDAGQFGLYAGCLPQKVPAVVEILQEELHKLAAEPITQEELARAIGQVRGATGLSQEDSASRMSRLGRAELALRGYQTIDEVLQEFEKVEPSQVQELATMLTQYAKHLVVVGPESVQMPHL